MKYLFEISAELIKELEAFGLSNDEARIVSILLNSTKTLTSNELAEMTEFQKHQLYTILSKLEKQKIIKQVSFKPKKFFSDQITFNESITLLEQQIENERNAFKETSDTNLVSFYQLLGFDLDQKRVHEYLLDHPATRNDLIRKMDFLTYEKARNITDFLINKNYSRKISSKGKSILYIGIPLKEIMKNKMDSLNIELSEKKNRVENIINLIEFRKDERSGNREIETQILNSNEEINKKISQTLIRTTNIKSSLFLENDENYSYWTKFVKNELKKTIESVESGKKFQWLVDKTFLKIFVEFENDLIEKIIKLKHKFQLRVTNKTLPSMMIFDNQEVLEISSTGTYLEKGIFVFDDEYTDIKIADFDTIWEDSSDIQQLVGEMLDEKKLIYFMGQNIIFKQIPTINIALLGDKGVGKTSLVKRFLTSKFDPNLNYTLGILVDDTLIKLPKRSFSNIEQMKLMIFDFGGQQLFKEAYVNQLEDKRGIGLIFSLNDPESLDNLESWIDLIGKEELDKKSVVLIGTKSDLTIKVDQDQLWDFRKKYRIENYFETSAVNGKNVHKVFEELAEQLSYTIHENEIFN
ncbi:MAG: hypothetical protein HeimC3_30880 [Candidatus Heimdallarchaeota archaeon LC_3]|nr:MAG: hypothetical protein HeimC3_30880 [Candidatus Heimdallarchaeota archaeon LC_3]